MKSSFNHIQINIASFHRPFYKELLTFLGWKDIYEDENIIGFQSGKNGSLWFKSVPNKKSTNYDEYGINHIGISVEKEKHVDDTVAFLEKHNISPLFNTPRHRKEFAASDKETYYQVMFESADKILFEVLYAGPRGHIE